MPSFCTRRLRRQHRHDPHRLRRREHIPRRPRHERRQTRPPARRESHTGSRRAAAAPASPPAACSRTIANCLMSTSAAHCVVSFSVVGTNTFDAMTSRCPPCRASPCPDDRTPCRAPSRPSSSRASCFTSLPSVVDEHHQHRRLRQIRSRSNSPTASCRCRPRSRCTA